MSAGRGGQGRYGNLSFRAILLDEPDTVSYYISMVKEINMNLKSETAAAMANRAETVAMYPAVTQT